MECLRRPSSVQKADQDFAVNVMVEKLEELVNGKQNGGRRRRKMMDDIRMRHQEVKRLVSLSYGCVGHPLSLIHI